MVGSSVHGVPLLSPMLGCSLHLCDRVGSQVAWFKSPMHDPAVVLSLQRRGAASPGSVEFLLARVGRGHKGRCTTGPQELLND